MLPLRLKPVLLTQLKKSFCEEEAENNDKRKNKNYQAVNQDTNGVRSTALTIILGFAV
jgi:hypothetical protein